MNGSENRPFFCTLCVAEHIEGACPGYTIEGAGGVVYRTKAINGADVHLIGDLLAGADADPVVTARQDQMLAEFRAGKITREMVAFALGMVKVLGADAPTEFALDLANTTARLERELELLSQEPA